MAKMSPLLMTLLFIVLSSMMMNQLPVASSKKWCVATPTATEKQLGDNMEFACAIGVDCRPIMPSGACFLPNTTLSHASFLMNSYFQSHDQTDHACYFFFPDSSIITTTDPSYDRCIYPSH
ncbi:hypothetical protein AALP_AAs58904U000400 [Arabis alpina]|uniref:X8 domain-containing protein n=1 Tax=Arabis alpina TaxID=50452 RepID=A0A087FZY0_ARAAL|nr:hypothetical protein AALP_AAs58904U000400 [Arabis alpina]